MKVKYFKEIDIQRIILFPGKKAKEIKIIFY